MPEYSNTRFTGFLNALVGGGPTALEVPLKLMGDSSEYTVLEGEGLYIEYVRSTSGSPSGIYSVYLSYDDDGATQHIPMVVYEEASGWSPAVTAVGEYYVTYPAPAGKTWKVWALGPENYDEWYIHLGGTITNKQ
jgi:hypothetical protein